MTVSSFKFVYTDTMIKLVRVGKTNQKETNPIKARSLTDNERAEAARSCWRLHNGTETHASKINVPLAPETDSNEDPAGDG